MPSKEEIAEKEIIGKIKKDGEGLNFKEIKKGLRYNEDLIRRILKKLIDGKILSEEEKQRRRDRQKNKVYKYIAKD